MTGAQETFELEAGDSPRPSLASATGSASSERLNLYEEHAKEKGKLPANWKAYKFECFPKRDETIYIAITGAVCTAKKANGHTDWKKLDKKTEATINLPVTEHKEWRKAWEVRAGKCSECVGTGEELESASVKEGVKYRPCRKCKGAKTPNK